MLFLNVCEDSNFLSTIALVKNVILVIQIVVPALLVVLCAVDLAKKVFDDKFQAIQKIGKRLIAAALIFFVPLFVSVLLEEVGQTSFTKTSCWTNANTETIAYLREIEDAEEEAQKEKDKEEQKNAEEQRKAREEYKEAVRQKNKEEADKKKPSEYPGTSTGNNNGNESTVLLNENGKDGLVEVINGVFYIRGNSSQNGTDASKGSSPYGYNKFFFARLSKMIEDGKALGYTIKYSTSEQGAWRPLKWQEYFYNCYVTQSCNNGNLAAKPGTSNHGWGIASDLDWNSTEALYWMHDNCSKYGLKFNLCNNVRDKNNCRESWHIQPAQLNGG